jgi:multidrug efflux pump subunit AcrA (membrane-fusion protein)
MNAMAVDGPSVVQERLTEARDPGGRRRPGRKGFRVKWLSSLGAVLCIGALGVVVTGRHISLGSVDADQDALTVPVARGDLVVTVTEDGQVESATNVNVRCEVPGPIRILEIVEDGTQVKPGEALAKLDSSSIEEEIVAQEIATAKAEAARVKAEKDLAAAAIAVDEYVQGTFVQDLRKLEIDLTVARQTLSDAESVMAFATRMHRKGYATSRELKAKRYFLEQAKRDIGLVELKKEVLEKYTRPKMLEELNSTRDSAAALLTSETAALQQERAKLERSRDQLEKCTLRAPQDGMAIYANDRQNWGEAGPKIELGARVNQFQAIIRLPDLRQMQVKSLIHETKVDLLRLGLPARIKIQDREFDGEVTSIANQPEPSGFWQGYIKEYAVVVRITGEPEQLKPGKTAEVRILVDERKNVLLVPVQCVVQHEAVWNAWVRTPQGTERRELLLGARNDTQVEIVDGLKEGERVVLTPRADSLAPREDQ